MAALVERLVALRPDERSFALILALVAALDFVTGYELAFSIFYILPVAGAAWVFGNTTGLLVSALCAFIWVGTNLLAGQPLSAPAIAVWNGLTRLANYTLLTFLLTQFRHSFEREQRRARHDDLTGAITGRAFRDVLEREAESASQAGRTLALAYLDLDNFKRVNDRFGHCEGDELLRTFAAAAHAQLQPGTLFARVGGDEFLFLLSCEADPRLLLHRLHRTLNDAVLSTGFGASCTMGAVVVPPRSGVAPGEIVRSADALMFEAKRAGKARLLIESIAEAQRQAGFRLAAV